MLKEFARRYYKNIAYFNFDEHPEYKQFFENTKDVERILQNLMMASGETIKRDKPEDTLIVFDEIQECPNALNTLKYFCENTPHYNVARRVHWSPLSYPNEFDKFREVPVPYRAWGPWGPDGWEAFHRAETYC